MAHSIESLPVIAVSDLRVGMMVHLGMSWLSHPFPRSSFRISTEKQLATIRNLGVTEVHWDPAHSLAVLTPDDAPEAEPTTPGVHVEPEAITPERLQAEAAAAERRARLHEQRNALMACERQFSEATRQYTAVLDQVHRDPQAAARGATDLTRGFADIMKAKDLCVRVLAGRDGDKLASHSINVTILSMLMGHTFGWSETEMMDLGVGALMHDIGKIELPSRLTKRLPSFTAAEARLYEEHVNYGVALGRKLGLSNAALSVVAEHHELGDRSGFPKAIGTNRMSAAARVVALINRYDNLCNPPNSTELVTPHDAISRLFALGKDKFDVTIMAAFIKLMGVYPAGSTVQLTDKRYAMVMAVNSSPHSTRSLKPQVMVYDPATPHDEALLVDLEADRDLGILRGVKPHDLPEEARAYLQPRPRIRFAVEPIVEEQAA
jgi:putative nucleotidyltransferase with HDIG domain